MKIEEAISLLQRGLVGEIYDTKGYLTSVGYEALDAIDSDKCPTLVQKQHGEWEFIGENLFKCTNCGYIADANYLRKWKVHTHDAEFPTACLSCGADMRKEGGEK